MTALLLTAVDGTRVKASIATTADHLVAVILASEHLERRLDNTTTKTQDQMEGRLLLDVVVAEGAAIFELLTSEDQTLLVGGDTLLVLDLLLDVLDGVGALDLEGDGLASQSLDENLHDGTAETERKEGY